MGWRVLTTFSGLWTIAGILGAVTPVVVAQGPPAAPVPLYARADIAYGAQIYTAQCSTCHGPTGDGVGGVDLRSGRFRNGTTDQDLTRIVTTGIAGTGMLGFKFDAPEIAGIVVYLRNMTTFDTGSVKPGDAGRGRTVFEQQDCTRCHRIGAQGARVAPDLSDIGASRSAASLERSLLEPTSQMMPINRPVRLVTRDGTVITGRRLNEDTYTVQIIDDREHLRSIDKADVRDYTILTQSPMPAYKDTLGAGEISDLLAYLLSLKGR